MTSVVIPAYHPTEDHVKLTLELLDSMKYGRPDEVIIVDDGSPFPLPEQEDITHIVREDNGGFPLAVNDGWAASHGDIIITCNNDISLTPGWLEAIIKPLEEGYDISSIRTSDGDGYTTQDVITEGDKFGSLWAMKRKVYDTIGPFDTFGKIYFEDTDYRRRAMEAGFKVGKNHAHVVGHAGRATMDVIDPDREHYVEAMRKYAEKWGTID